MFISTEGSWLTRWLWSQCTDSDHFKKKTEQLEEISYIVGAKHVHVAMATEINKLVIGDSDSDHDVKGVL